MGNTLQYATYLNEVKAKASELDRLLNDELGFKLSEVLGSYASLFSRFCPYEVGDLVELKQDLDIPQDSGWYHCKHFLVEGAIATVKELGYRNNLFTFGLVFDNETYMDMHGETKPVEVNHLFYLSETLIKIHQET